MPMWYFHIEIVVHYCRNAHCFDSESRVKEYFPCWYFTTSMFVCFFHSSTVVLKKYMNYFEKTHCENFSYILIIFLSCIFHIVSEYKIRTQLFFFIDTEFTISRYAFLHKTFLKVLSLWYGVLHLQAKRALPVAFTDKKEN